MSHIPVLLKEVIHWLDVKPEDFVVDGTLGGGGYSRNILSSLGSAGHLMSLDLDHSAIDAFSAQLNDLKPKAKVTLVVSNFKDVSRLLSEKSLDRIDKLVLDLGFSSLQLEESGRGFSFNHDEPLLMTYADDSPSVAELLKTLSEEELADVIYQYGGERYSRRVARAIKEVLRDHNIVGTGELAAIIRSALPKHYERGRIDPATRTFQALRIYANHELDNLRELLDSLSTVMASAGRVVIVSFHSLEDKLVKESFRELFRSGQAELLTKKPITPTPEEIKSNPRSRSAKLRALKFK